MSDKWKIGFELEQYSNNIKLEIKTKVEEFEKISKNL